MMQLELQGKRKKKKDSLTTLQNRQDHHFSSAGALLCMELSCWGDLFLQLHQKEAQRIDSGENPEPKNHLELFRLFLEIRQSLALRYMFLERRSFDCSSLCLTVTTSCEFLQHSSRKSITDKNTASKMKA